MNEIKLQPLQGRFVLHTDTLNLFVIHGQNEWGSNTWRLSIPFPEVVVKKLKVSIDALPGAQVEIPTTEQLWEFRKRGVVLTVNKKKVLIQIVACPTHLTPPKAQRDILVLEDDEQGALVRYKGDPTLLRLLQVGDDLYLRIKLEE